MNPSKAPRRMFDPRAVWIMVKKEFSDNVRNKWIIAISAIFIILTLVVSYFGAAQTQSRTGFQALSETVTGMLSIETLLVPILGLMLGYAAIVGEKEQGSIQLLLSMPITRVEAVLGKFLGLATVMMTSILFGLGIAGIIVMVSAGAEGWESYVIFILGSMLFALAFLTISLLLSTVTRRRSGAMGIAVFLWFFFAMIFDLILLGVYVATGGSFGLRPGGQSAALPDWYYAISLANPASAFSMFSLRIFGISESFGFITQYPSFITAATAGLSMMLWIVVPLGLSLWRFQKQDL